MNKKLWILDFFKTSLFFVVFLISCTSESDILYLEYCIPVDVSTPYDTSPARSPSVGIVRNYTIYTQAPAASDSVVENYVIATEIPNTIVSDPFLGEDELSIYDEDIAIVDNLSVSSDVSVAARVAYRGKTVFAVQDASIFIPGLYQSVDGIIGGDLLRNFAVRFHYTSDRQCSFFWDEEQKTWPNVLFLREQPATSEELGDDGFGVVNFSLAGGGNYTFNDREREMVATRVTVRVCAQADPFPLYPVNPEYAPPPDPGREGRYPVSGIELTALIATGTVPLLTTTGGLERLSQQISVTGGTSSMSSVQFSLPEGIIEAASLSGLTRLAIIGSVSSDLGPCDELARRRGQEYSRRYPELENPYYNDTDYSGAAVLEVDLEKGNYGNFDLIGIPSTTDYWQGLWAETSPEIPEIDLILGHDFLSWFNFTIDYIDSRLVMRCLQYDCSNTAFTCCNAPDGACFCPENDPCCQFFKFKK